MRDRKERVILSDHFMQKEVYKQTMEKMHRNRYKNIVIVGGSASGFSSAWLILNGPADYRMNNSMAMRQTLSEFPRAQRKYIQNCKDCCTCTDKRHGCSCICKCLGYFVYKDWEFDYSMLPKHFREANIKILYRDKIRVFYPTVNAAKADGYKDFDERIFSRKDGYLYSYTGLRGNAKTLYKRVISGQEKRIRLIQAESPKDQAKHIQAADLVIWSCGYQTNKITIKNQEGIEIPLGQKVAFTQYDVDAKCRIQTIDGTILTKSFGTGIAYPTRTNDGMQMRDGGKPNPRADSFSLYCNWVANRVLLNLLQANLLASKIQRTAQVRNYNQLQPKEAVGFSPQKTHVARAVSKQRSSKSKPKQAGHTGGKKLSRIPLKSPQISNFIVQETSQLSSKLQKLRQLEPIKSTLRNDRAQSSAARTSTKLVKALQKGEREPRAQQLPGLHQSKMGYPVQQSEMIELRASYRQKPDFERNIIPIKEQSQAQSNTASSALTQASLPESAFANPISNQSSSLSTVYSNALEQIHNQKTPTKQIRLREDESPTFGPNRGQLGSQGDTVNHDDLRGAATYSSATGKALSEMLAADKMPQRSYVDERVVSGMAYGGGLVPRQERSSQVMLIKSTSIVYHQGDSPIIISAGVEPDLYLRKSQIEAQQTLESPFKAALANSRSIIQGKVVQASTLHVLATPGQAEVPPEACPKTKLGDSKSLKAGELQGSPSAARKGKKRPANSQPVNSGKASNSLGSAVPISLQKANKAYIQQALDDLQKRKQRDRKKRLNLLGDSNESNVKQSRNAKMKYSTGKREKLLAVTSFSEQEEDVVSEIVMELDQIQLDGGKPRNTEHTGWGLNGDASSVGSGVVTTRLKPRQSDVAGPARQPAGEEPFADQIYSETHDHLDLQLGHTKQMHEQTQKVQENNYFKAGQRNSQNYQSGELSQTHRSSNDAALLHLSKKHQKHDGMNDDQHRQELKQEAHTARREGEPAPSKRKLGGTESRKSLKLSQPVLQSPAAKMGKSISKAKRLHNILYKAEQVNTKTRSQPGKAAHRRITPPGATINPYLVGVGSSVGQEDEVEGDDEYGVKGQGNSNCDAEVGPQEESVHLDLFKTTPVLQTLSRQEIASRRPSFPVVPNQYYQQNQHDYQAHFSKTAISNQLKRAGGDLPESKIGGSYTSPVPTGKDFLTKVQRPQNQRLSSSSLVALRRFKGEDALAAQASRFGAARSRPNETPEKNRQEASEFRRCSAKNLNMQKTMHQRKNKESVYTEMARKSALQKKGGLQAADFSDKYYLSHVDVTSNNQDKVGRPKRAKK